MINPEIYGSGMKVWHNSKGETHRDNGPAVMWVGGSKFWYQNSKLHREDGPASEYSDGIKMWYINGTRIF